MHFVDDLFKALHKIMTTQAEHAQALQAVTANVAKIGDETRALLTKISDLTAAVAAAGNTTPEVDAAMAALEAQVQAVQSQLPNAG